MEVLAVGPESRAAEWNGPTAAVSLYTPRSLFDLPDSVWKLCAWQYDALSLGALETYFRGEKKHE